MAHLLFLACLLGFASAAPRLDPEPDLNRKFQRYDQVEEQQNEENILKIGYLAPNFDSNTPLTYSTDVDAVVNDVNKLNYHYEADYNKDDSEMKEDELSFGLLEAHTSEPVNDSTVNCVPYATSSEKSLGEKDDNLLHPTYKDKINFYLNSYRQTSKDDLENKTEYLYSPSVNNFPSKDTVIEKEVVDTSEYTKTTDTLESGEGTSMISPEGEYKVGFGNYFRNSFVRLGRQVPEYTPEDVVATTDKREDVVSECSTDDVCDLNYV